MPITTHSFVALLFVLGVPGSIGSGMNRTIGHKLASAHRLADQVASPPQAVSKLTVVEFLREFAKQKKISFVVEGNLDAASLVRQFQFTPSSSNELTDKDLEAVALACDFDIKRNQSTYVLTRRYSLDQEAFPDITIDEAIAAASNINKLVSPFRTTPHGDTPSSLISNAQQFLLSLSDQQREEIKKRGVSRNDSSPTRSYLALPMSELTPQQRSYIWNISLNFYLENRLEGLDQLIKKLTEIKKGKPSFSFVDISGSHLLALYPSHAADAQQYIPIGAPGKVDFSSGTFAISSFKIAGQPLEVSPKSVAHNTVPPIKASEENKATVTTLGQAVERFCGDTTEVDERIADKQVSVLLPPEGISSGFNNSLPANLASIYGLVLVQGETKRRITLPPSPKTVTDISKLSDAIAHAMPEPILRAVRKNVEDKAAANKSNPVKDFSRDDERVSAIRQLRSRTTNQFCALLEPRVENSLEHKVLYSSLSTQENHLLMVVLFTTYLSAIGRFDEEKTPFYVSNFDDIYVVCSSTSPNEGPFRTDKSDSITRYRLSLCRGNESRLMPLVGLGMLKLE